MRNICVIKTVCFLTVCLAGISAIFGGYTCLGANIYGGGNLSSSNEPGPDSARISDRFSLYYRWDRTNLDENYLDNAVQMMRIRHYLAESPRIDSITIYAYASPEGVYERNVRLSKERARMARRYILANIPERDDFDETCIRIHPMGENWAGLETELEANYHRHDRERVLAILRAPVRADTKKWRLKQLDGGYTYRYIIRRHMPKLRTATLICIWGAPIAAPIARPLECSVDGADRAALSIPKADTVPPVHVRRFGAVQTVPAKTEPKDKRTFLGLKSNLLYDAVTALNFAVEVPFGKRFSLLYEHHCPWWLSRNNRYCLQFLSFGGEFRWWFLPKTREASAKRVKRDALMGHFLGVYGMGGKFDIQANRKFCYQGEFFSAGVTYGYSMPVSKRLNLEFSISAGYARIPYRHYIPTDDWELLVRDPNKVGVLHYFGPTKVEVSLVVPLLVNVRKRGGAR